MQFRKVIGIGLFTAHAEEANIFQLLPAAHAVDAIEGDSEADIE